jgi:hypothetical protein
MDWVAPKGYELCADGKCWPPQDNGKDKDDAKIWQCKPSYRCEGKGCGCYLAIIAPGGKQLRIEDKPGGKGSSRRLPPGWAYVCACMKELDGEKETGWSVREDLGWIAPKGYKFADKCPEGCFLPQNDPKDSDYWTCGSGDDCCLVAVPPGEKHLTLLAGPPGKFLKADVPQGWGIFCACLKKI